MSNALAIAAVSNTLRTLIDRGLRDGTVVTIQPPDLARENQTGRQVNLFLYQVALNPAFRNMDAPGRVRPNETGMPPLALNLYYLLTAYAGENDDDSMAHSLLGRAMSLLHDHPVLGREEIQAALTGNDLFAQVERIRLSLQTLTIDDVFKLWSGFQTEYRLSVAYEATVVLIDSAIASRTPLPVLTFGPKDTGPTAQASLTPAYPALNPGQLVPAVDITPGTLVSMGGFNLQASGSTARVRFRNPISDVSSDVPVEAGATEAQVQVKIPATLPAGIYSISAVINAPRVDQPAIREDKVTNELPLAISPSVTGIGPTGGAITTKFDNPIPVAPNPQGVVDLTITLSPSVGPNQRVALLFGAAEVAAQARAGTQPSDRARFLINQPAAKAYRIRVRVDGVDSPLIDWSQVLPVFSAPVVEVTS
jgi:hypothetical protein